MTTSIDEIRSDPVERALIEEARLDPERAAALIDRYSSLLHEPGGGTSNGQAKAVRLLGLEATIAAASRLSARVQAGLGWETPDFWTFTLGLGLGDSDPELGWDFVCELVEVVEETALPSVGASQLEDFCWMAAGSHIELIERQAQASPRFRTALGEVWPNDERMPPEIYKRIRAAAGFEWAPCADRV